MLVAALLLLAGAASTTPAPVQKAAPPVTATPPQEKIEVRLRKKIPEGTQLEVRGSFVVTVDFLEKQAAVEGNPPAVTQIRIDVARIAGKPNLPPKLTTGLTFSETVPAPPGTAMNPSAIAARLRSLGAALPQRAWLTVYSETNGAVRIEGAAVSPEDIAAFMRALNDDPLFETLVLLSAERAPDGVATTFALTAAAPKPKP